VFFAFLVDMALYQEWQVILMRDAPLQYRYVPFFGLAAWLLRGGRA
jgi:hypothetical protein